jgi:hypothetical protein
VKSPAAQVTDAHEAFNAWWSDAGALLALDLTEPWQLRTLAHLAYLMGQLDGRAASDDAWAQAAQDTLMSEEVRCAGTRSRVDAGSEAVEP